MEPAPTTTKAPAIRQAAIDVDKLSGHVARIVLSINSMASAIRPVPMSCHDEFAHAALKFV
jgi:hypothetical protein